MADARRTIVIVGAGFGGINVYKQLRSRIDRAAWRIVIVNRTNHFLFAPLLHEVATGGLGVQNASQGVREIIDDDCAELVNAQVTDIDRAASVVHTGAGPIPYDHLVLATGATTDFMGVPGAAEHALTLKDFSDAIKLRGRLIDSFEQAAARGHTQNVSGQLSFVVVGGGPTGVEVATEMADLFSHTFQRYYRRHITADQVTITLVHAGSRLLGQFHAALGTKAEAVLAREGVRVLLNARVTSVTADGVTLTDGTRIDARTVIWAAGVKPLVPTAQPALPVHAGGRVHTDPTLQVHGTTTLWALGDVAAVSDGHGGLVPMRAQAAVLQAPTVARNILAAIAGRKLRAFRYRPKGDLVSLGRWNAVGDIAGVHWSGPVAWWLWRTVYLFNMASWAKRLRIAVDWTVNLFYPRDITRSS